jgi:hypothetical protein
MLLSVFCFAPLGVFAVFEIAAVLHGAAKPDFAISDQPQSETTDAGQQITYLISITPLNGFRSSVTLTAAQVPPAAKASWSDQSPASSGCAWAGPKCKPSTTLAAGQRSAFLTIQTAASTPSSTYHPSVTATSAKLRHVTMTLALQTATAPNFKVSDAQLAQTVARGAASASTVTVTRSNWSGSVSLDAASVSATGKVTPLPVTNSPPAGRLSAVFSPNPNRASTSREQLTIYASATIPTGTYTIRVSGRGTLSPNSTSTRFAAIALTVQQNQRVAVAVSGGVSTPLYPGAASQPLPITLTNPNDVPIRVYDLPTSIQFKGPTGCVASWFQVSDANISSTHRVTVPANGSVTVPSATAPSIRMVESGTSQNSCQNVKLTFRYAWHADAVAAAAPASTESPPELPFTGFELWLVAACGVLLGVAGVALRRAVRES